MDSGTLVAERFRIVRLAGQGGFGKVYRALDTSSSRDVALKVFAREQTDFARFEREVEVLAGLHHRHVVAYVAHGVTGEGAPYLAMDWLEGTDLARRLEQGPLPMADALTVVLRAAQGLAAAHEQGIVHRDVKPSNLFLVGDRADEVRVIDFGVARARESAFSRLTATGAVLGTPSYMAPEQARGARDITPRADVFALGTVLFECLIGAPAFDGPSPHAILAKILSGSLPRVADRRSDLPAVIDVLLARMLAHEPEERLADGIAAAAAISSVLAEGAHIGGPLTPIPQRPVRAHTTVLARGVDVRDRDEVAALAAELGGEAHAIEETLVASFSARAPADAARRAAQFAVALRQQRANVALAIVTLRRDTIAGPQAIDAELAQRQMTLEGSAIVVDAGTARHLSSEYELVEDGAQFRLRGIARVRSTAPQTSLRGRARELAALDGAFTALLEDRCASLVLVLGDQGSGKSALVDQAARRYAEHGSRPRILRARGDRPTSTSPFSIAAQLVRARVEAPVTREALHAQLVADGLGDVDVAFACELAGFHGEALELAAARRDPLIMADAYRAAWLGFLEAQLASAPVVAIIDDLQLVDPASLHLLTVALEQLADSPLLIVASARADEAVAALGVLDKRATERIAIRPLRDHLARELVYDIAPDADEKLVAGIVERAGGNPLYLTELARVATARTPPASVLAAIESRIAQLESGVQRVLRAASVFGIAFPEAGVAALLASETRPTAALDTARRERLIVPSHGEWRFASSLVQEAAYEALAIDERHAAHGAVARWLQGRGPSDPSLVAWHFERAEDTDAALAAYTAAARLALDGRDVERALALASRGLACNPKDAALARLLTIRAEAAFAGNDPNEGKRAAEAAMAAAKAGSVEWLTAAGLLVTAAGQLGDNDAVQALAERVLREPHDVRGAGLRDVCLLRAASQLFAAGRHAIARELADERRATTDMLARAWLARLDSAFAVIADDYDAGIATSRESLRRFAAAGDVRGACQARIFVASFHVFVGELEAAESELDVADAIARRTGADYFARWANYTRGKILALGGEPATARDHLERVRAALSASPRIVAGTHIFGGLAALRVKDYAWAEREARDALAAHVAPSTRAQSLAILARALAGCGRADESLAAAEQAGALLREQGRVEENEGVIHVALVEALHAAGHHEAARDAAAAAAARLHAIAARIASPARRESYLQRIESHARTLQLAEQLA